MILQLSVLFVVNLLLQGTSGEEDCLLWKRLLWSPVPQVHVLQC